MATHTGIDGVVKYYCNAIGELTSRTLDVTQDIIEDTKIGDDTRTYQTGLVGRTRSADVFWQIPIRTVSEGKNRIHRARRGQR